MRSTALEPQFRKCRRGVISQGKQVTDQTATYAAFQELGRSALLKSASKVLDMVATSRGFAGERSDASQACMRTELKGDDTWIEWGETTSLQAESRSLRCVS